MDRPPERDRMRADANVGACPSDNTLAGFAARDTSSLEAHGLLAHLEQCGSCSAHVRALAVLYASEAEPDDGRSCGIAPSDPAARYLFGRELGRGGMGIVYEAWDARLSRRVAIKTLRHRHGASHGARFEREMELTARLEHPSIIPIHDSGRLADGGPFYVMRLVRGESLADRVATLSSVNDRLALLPAFVQLVDAIAHAHEQRIVHRDLKPHNVIVGPFEEPVVLDWGLAKVIGAADGGEPSVSSGDSDSPDLTGAGQIVGTPGYMAPEQRAGRPADTRSDVYSLGRILRFVLEGTPPAEWDEARPRLDGVVGDLWAIVRRATATAPGDRYPDARSLVADLQRFSAGRLVDAHSYTTRERLGRFVRRHRAAVIVASVGVSLLLGTGALSLHRIVQASREARAERAQAVEGRIAAEKLVDFAIGDLRERLEALDRLDVLEGVGERVDEYYRDVAILPGPEGISELERRGDALMLVGDVRRGVGDIEGAVAAYTRSLADFDRAGERGGSPHGGCLALLRIGEAWQDLAESERARAAYGECSRLARERLERGSDDEARWIALVAESEAALGRLVKNIDGRDRARVHFEQALDYARRLPSDGEADPRRLEVQVHLALAVAAAEVGAWQDSRRDVEAAGLVLDRSFADATDDHELASMRLLRVELLGKLAEVAGDAPAAAAAQARATAIASEMVARDPANARWKANLAICRHNEGVTAHSRGDYAAARDHLLDAIERGRELLARDPRNQAWRHQFALSLGMLGTVEHERKALEPAGRLLEEAIRTLEPLAVGDDRQRASELATFRLLLASVRADRRELDVAVPLLEQALQSFRALAEADPSAQRSLEVAQALAVGAVIDAKRRRWSDRDDKVAEARRILGRLDDGEDPISIEGIRSILRDAAGPT